MLKKKLGVLIVVVVMGLSLIGCGQGGYDFSSYELTNAIGMSESGMKKSVVKFQKGDVNYTATIDNGGSTEYISVTFNKSSKEAVGLNLSIEGNAKSKYSIYGVHAGDSGNEAKASMEAVYGAGTGTESDLSTYLSYVYEDDEHGFVNYVVNKKTEKVTDISMMRK